MVTQIKLGDILVDVIRKDIKNLHLSVHPPSGKVTIAAPSRMAMDAIRVFVITKLSWIRSQQRKLREQERETGREYIERESHYVWGRRYLLRIVERDAAATVELKHNNMVLQVRPGTDSAKRHAVLEEWYRSQLRRAVEPLLVKWEPALGVKAKRVYVQRMKTKWGSCNHDAGHIRLNTELVKKPRDLLEYVTVHEMLHLLEPTHGERFVSLLSQHYPNWQMARAALNDLPLGAEVWKMGL